MDNTGERSSMVNVPHPGANVLNVLRRNEATPLQKAALSGDLNEAKRLIEAGADINCKSFADLAPLHLAALNGHSEMVELLLHNKADIEIRGQLKNTALHWAVFNGKIDVIKILLKNGADVFAMSNHGTVLHEAVRNARILKMILAEIQNRLVGDAERLRTVINTPNKEGSTPLIWAVYLENFSAIKLILKCQETDVNKANLQGTTALHYAAQNANFKIAEILIKHGADVCAKNNHDSVLHNAVRNVEVLKLVLIEIQKKLDGDAERLKSVINDPDTEGDTPLMWAVELKELGAIKLLVECDEIDVNKKNLAGYTALHWAAYNAYFEAVEILVRKGADVFAKNDHDSVLHDATRNVESLKVVLAEIKRKCKGNAGQLRLAMNVADTEGDTPLMWAVEKGDLSATKLLLECEELDINQQNLQGWTALHWAAHDGHLEIVKFLAGKKVDTKIKDENGETAYDMAKRKISEDAMYQMIADFLIKSTNVRGFKRLLRIF